MELTVKQSLFCLSVALLLLPLTHRKPGTPPTLKADEPAYYGAALSLVKDGDLRCEPKDLARIYREYPYAPIYNLILSTDDGWHTVYFGKPYLYSLLAAPFAAVWGANGLVLFNSLLLVAMIWMATHYLSRFNPDWLAALFAAGFFLMSTTYNYVYWLQPELLNMFSTAACLFFGLHAYGGGSGVDGGSRRFLDRLTSDPDHLALVLSAATLAIGVYNKPMMAAMGLPVVFRLLSGRRWRDLAVWLASAAIAIGVFAGLSTVLTGHPTAYLGIDRQGYNVHTPYVMPMEPEAPPPPGASEAPELGKATAGWWWIFQRPTLAWSEFSEDLRYFFVGRHTGLFLYQPFSLIALGLFAGGLGRRSAERWVVLASIALLALFLLVFLSHNWHGGGGFVGNRYFLMVYPAFVFLVTRIRPDWIVAAGFAAGGLFVGALVLSPFGLVVPSPTLQANARNHPFQLFPLEHSLLEMPGYRRESRAGMFVLGRKDHLWVEGEDLWIAAGERAELWLSSAEPLSELVLEVESPVPGNEVSLRVEDAEARVVAGETPRRVVLRPSRPTLERDDRDRARWPKLVHVYVYRLEVRAAAGEVPSWRGRGEQFFYQGCVLRFPDTGEAESVRIEE